MSKQKEKTKGTLIIPSKSFARLDPKLEDVEETEIVAAISLSPDGGWGWVVVFSSFLIFFILDGVFFTFGSIYQDMTEDLELEGTLVALLNSVAVALYFIAGPLVSALVNRFGFRACTLSGSIVLCISFLLTYFSVNYLTLMLFYGFTAGFGACMVLVPSTVVVGFYFERLRAMALAIAGLGSSLGIMIMFTVNSLLVNLAGWRIVTLFHSGLFGFIYFLGMAYRPLVVVTLTQTINAEEATRTVTYLPSLRTVSRVRKEGHESTTTAAERLFSAVSSPKFPTAAAVIQESMKIGSNTQVGPSRHISKLTVSPRNAAGSMSQKHISQIRSRIANIDQVNIELEVQNEQKKRKWWAILCCEWESHVQESRPMYRDDAFYAGNIEKLPIYQKSVIESEPSTRTGFEYNMAVSRAAKATDLEERKHLCTTAVRSVLATMLDPELLKRCSFLLLCLSAVFTYIGLLTPYVFLADRNRGEGIGERHCNLFVSVIGFFNALGRIMAGVLATKFSPLFLYLSSCILSGIGTIAYNYSYDVYYQYFCCIIFGTFIAAISGLRSMVIVECYGLEKLTNATGVMLMSQGVGSLISTPLSGILKASYGYAMSFYAAGVSLILSGIVLIPVKMILRKENKGDEND